MCTTERAIAFLHVYYSQNCIIPHCFANWTIWYLSSWLYWGLVLCLCELENQLTLMKTIVRERNHKKFEPSSKVFSPIRCIPGVGILVVFFNSTLSRSICACSSMHCTSITLSYDTFLSWIPFRFHSNKSIHLYQAH